MREMYYANFADYVLVNDDFDHALNMLKGIIVFNRIIDNDLSSWAKKLINLDNCIV